MRRILFSTLVALLLSIPFPVGSQGATGSTTVTIYTQTGTVDGAAYRIDVPSNWNGVLLMYYHGFLEAPEVYNSAEADPVTSTFYNAGYAVAESGYSEIGWAVEQAIPQTEALRLYAISIMGTPKETYVVGHSMGGLLTAATIETYPTRYNGALAFCGMLQPATWGLERGGAILAAFDYYYPNVLPNPLTISAGAALSTPQIDQVLSALPSNPVGQEELMALGPFHNTTDLATGVVFDAFIQRDLQQKSGGSALNNTNFIYAGGADDNNLNDKVTRYTASPAATSFLKEWYTPTGVLTKPLLAVHTTYDPIVPANTVSVYSDLVDRTGSQKNFVQQFVKENGHCAFTAAQELTALQELVTWKRTGTRPAGGPVPGQ